MSDDLPPATEATAADRVGRVARSLYGRWAAIRGRESTVAVLTLLGVLSAPYLLVTLPGEIGLPRQYTWYHSLLTLTLIWSIFAIGYDLLLGFTGLLSFGHAMFWGTAAYAAGVFSAEVAASPLGMILVGTTCAVLLAWVIGWISLRRGGIYFAILTLAFGQMLYNIALSPLKGITGGENGFTDVDVGPVLGVVDLGASVPFVPGTVVASWMYLFVGAMAVLAVVVGYRILNSPYGIVLRAIRENERRAEFVGLNVWRYKLMAFVISGAFAGAAGSLYTIQRSYVPIENTLQWTVSGDIVIITVLGGVGSLFGPILGAGLYMYVANIVSGISGIGAFWHLLLGVVFVAVITTMPNGLWGGVSYLREQSLRLPAAVATARTKAVAGLSVAREKIGALRGGEDE